MIKTVVIIFFIIESITSVKFCFSNQENWIRQNSPTTLNLKNCFFINNNTGWISGEQGLIMKTINAGLNWSFQNTGIINDIQSIYFINERLGWGVTYEVFPDSNSFLGTRILKTTNGGINWINYMYPDTNKFMRAIYFLDSLTGFMVGAPITIVRTGDAGNNWENMDTDSTLQLGLPVENIKFINSQIGYACGGFRDIAGTMWTSTNGGFNWKGQIVAPEPFNDIYIFNPLKALSVGGDFEYGSSYVKTFDQGRTWNYDTLGTFGIANAVDFRTSGEGWIALGIAQKFSYTLDTGKTWTAIYTPDSVSINDLQFTDSLHGWAVGYNGVILKYNNTATNIISETGNPFPDKFFLYQNYPNPFNPKTIIQYQLKTPNFISLKVFDINGKEVVTLVNKEQTTGSYTVEFDAENLSSGIYFYILNSGTYRSARKMMILK